MAVKPDSWSHGTKGQDFDIAKENELIEEMSRTVNKLHREGYNQKSICKELNKLCKEHWLNKAYDVVHNCQTQDEALTAIIEKL